MTNIGAVKFSLFGWLVSLLAFISNATAQDHKICHRVFDTAFDENVVKGCEPGDVLIAQIAANVAPAIIVGRYCNLNHSIFSETQSKQVTVVCSFVEQRRLR